VGGVVVNERLINKKNIIVTEEFYLGITLIERGIIKVNLKTKNQH
jgi:hypothetical protein